MDPFLAVVSVAAVTYTLVNLAKLVMGAIRRQVSWNGAITLVVAILIAWAVLMLFGGSVWGNQVVVSDQSIQDLSVLDKLVAALAVGGFGSVIYDWLNRGDYPKLTGSSTPPTPPPPST